MALVFELASRHHAWPRRQVRGESLQRLYARQLIRAHRSLPNLDAFGCGAIDGAHVSDLGVAVGVGGWGEPIADSMWLQVGRFSTTATHDVARCGR